MWRDVTVWNYLAGNASSAPVRFFFVHSPDGLVLASDSDSIESRQQLSWLQHARKQAIARDTRKWESAAAVRSIEQLPFEGHATYSRGGIFAELAVSIPDLLGAPLYDGVQYTLDVRVTGAGVSRRLGVVMARLTQQEISRSHGSDLRLALWFPSAPGSPGDLLEIIERPSGRTMKIALNGTSAPAAEYAIGKAITIASLLQGRGAALAYFAPTPRAPEPEAWLLTGTTAEPDVQLLPGNVLALLREKN